MTNEERFKSLMDQLADSITAKSNVPGKKTIPEMTEAVDSIIVPVGRIKIEELGDIDVKNYATAYIEDSNLIPENIKSGVIILGQEGTLDSTDEISSLLNANYTVVSNMSIVDDSNGQIVLGTSDVQSTDSDTGDVVLTSDQQEMKIVSDTDGNVVLK